jgi:hypothetical protein
MGGKELVKIDEIRQLIYTLRGVQVMIDRDRWALRTIISANP